MSDVDLEQVPPQRVMVVRIIHAALCMGTIMFGGAMLLVRWLNAPALDPAQPPIITYVGLGMAAMALLMAWVLPGAIATQWRRQNGAALVRSAAGRPEGPAVLADGLVGAYQTTVIVAAALLEGAAFLLAIAYFLEGQSIALGGFLGMLVFLVLMHPTRERIRSWMAAQHALLEDEARMGG
jgi:hypothetical protein